MLCLPLMLVVSCASVGERSKLVCGPNDKALRLSDAQIDMLTDEQVKDILARNEELARLGCAVAN